jgi:Holliday junction resolvase RusA-like endonuclease
MNDVANVMVVKSMTDRIITVINAEADSTITIDGVVAGLNGDEGLMRSHWSDIKKIKKLYEWIIAEHLKQRKARKHEGPVIITYTGYKTVLMDWDNFFASFKHIGDSLKSMGIIKDDKPSVIIYLHGQQFKCKRKEQRVVITITDYKP